LKERDKQGYRKSEKLATLSPEQLEELLAQAETENPLDLLARKGAQALLQAALEAEIEEALGRSFYGRREEGQRGYRNGSRKRTLTSGVGELTIQAPRIADTDEPFHSKVLPAHARIVPKLQALFPLLYIEGLSTRDFTRAMQGAFGAAGLSKSSIARANKVIHEEFAAWRTRSLADEDIVDLFLDGVYLQIRRNSTETEGALMAAG
jgi:transposase-like protein